MKDYYEVAGRGQAPPTFQFDADGRSTTWIMSDAYCEEPQCVGSEADVWLAVVGNRSRRLHVGVDMIEAESHWKADLAPGDAAVAREFTRSPEVLRLLVRRRQIVRAWGLAHGEGSLLARENRLYNLGDFDLNRDNFVIPFVSGGREWGAIDQHCVNPTCDCEEVLLGFYEEDGTPQVRKQRFALRFALVGDNVASDAVTNGPPTTEQELVFADFKKELGDWQVQLRVRRTLIREVAARRVREVAARRVREVVPVASGTRVGRNEPCQCGSGKKFKKCCGAA